jgi:uncharacterized repeat protein (TIGR04076 family)
MIPLAAVEVVEGILQCHAKERNSMKTRDALRRFGDRVGFSDADLEHFTYGDPRTRLLERIAKPASQYSIEAKVVRARHCNSGHKVGDRFILDVDGNFITRLCPKRMCVYVVAQLAIPVALINERISEGLEPNGFHFMKQVRCSDVGVECGGYGEIALQVEVIPRVHG